MYHQPGCVHTLHICMYLTVLTKPNTLHIKIYLVTQILGLVIDDQIE